VKEGSKADPAKVAQDGYEALKAGKDKIISGFKNKAMVTSSLLMPDDIVAEGMLKQAEPSEK
jgi:short-subunit dehydrogenase